MSNQKSIHLVERLKQGLEIESAGEIRMNGKSEVKIVRETILTVYAECCRNRSQYPGRSVPI